MPAFLSVPWDPIPSSIHTRQKALHATSWGLSEKRNFHSRQWACSLLPRKTLSLASKDVFYTHKSTDSDIFAMQSSLKRSFRAWGTCLKFQCSGDWGMRNASLRLDGLHSKTYWERERERI
jgi:hypothetical protein